MPARTSRGEVRETVRIVRRSELGDVNVSTLMSVLAILGLSVVALA